METRTMIKIGIARRHPADRAEMVLFKISRKNEFQLINFRTHTFTNGDIEDIKAYCREAGLQLTATNKKGREIIK